jgi:hypothetical protein
MNKYEENQIREILAQLLEGKHGPVDLRRRGVVAPHRVEPDANHDLLVLDLEPLLAAIAAELGPEVFVLETDCPWLPPSPHRGARNEPAFVPLVAEALAGYLGITAAEVERITDAAARRLFRLPGGDET